MPKKCYKEGTYNLYCFILIMMYFNSACKPYYKVQRPVRIMAKKFYKKGTVYIVLF